MVNHYQPTKYKCPIFFYADETGNKPAAGDIKKFDNSVRPAIKNQLYKIQSQGLEVVAKKDVKPIKGKGAKGLEEIRLLSEGIRIYFRRLENNSGLKVYVVGSKKTQELDIERAKKLMNDDLNHENKLLSTESYAQSRRPNQKKYSSNFKPYLA